jgi:predicted RNA-binding protein (virulence factor B family)
MKLQAYIKQVREDNKIDLILQKAGVARVNDFSETLLQYIKDNDGLIPFSDKSQVDDIYRTFGVSKKTFKKAVGDLYKKRLIVLNNNTISLSTT